MQAGDRPPLSARDALAAAGVALCAAAVYLPAAGLEFAADDFLVLDQILRLGDLTNVAAYFNLNFYAYYRPLALLSFGASLEAWGPNAAAFHLTNVALHAVNVALVYVVARCVGGRGFSAIGALVFALHPANQEAVFWVAGRFDLLSTVWILAALAAFWSDRRPLSWMGIACFALALLSKESAVAVLVLAAAHGVILERRDARWAVRHLVPLVAVSVVYVVARHLAGLDPVGGPERVGKLVMLATGVGAVLWYATWRPAPAATPAARQVRQGLAVALAMAGLLWALMLAPAIATRLGPSLGFVAYAAWWLGPLGLLPEPPFLDPNRTSWIVAGILSVSALAGIVAAAHAWLRRRPAVLLALVAAGAALLPVSAMPGLTHLYLATTGVALLAALAVQSIASPARRTIVVVLVLAACGASLIAATARWQRASALTREAVALVTSHPVPCAGREIVLLTSPSGVDGIPGNLNHETFAILGRCVPRSLQTLLRVVREDADVTVARRSRLVVEIRVARYRHNVMASTDLRNFRLQVRDEDRQFAIDTPVGRLEARPEGASQVFELTLTEQAAGSSLYYYGGYRFHAVPEPGAASARN